MAIVRAAAWFQKPTALSSSVHSRTTSRTGRALVRPRSSRSAAAAAAGVGVPLSGGVGAPSVTSTKKAHWPLGPASAAKACRRGRSSRSRSARGVTPPGVTRARKEARRTASASAPHVRTKSSPSTLAAVLPRRSGLSRWNSAGVPVALASAAAEAARAQISSQRDEETIVWPG